jgi:hypothetical protein
MSSEFGVMAHERINRVKNTEPSTRSGTGENRTRYQTRYRGTQTIIGLNRDEKIL